MKDAADTKKDAAFIRDLIAMIGIKFTADKREQDLREAMLRKAFAEVPAMDETHVRRLHEALCAMDFATDAALAVRRATGDRLARVHNLRAYREIKLPTFAPRAERTAQKGAAL
jgi:hypothetical protein